MQLDRLMGSLADGHEGLTWAGSNGAPRTQPSTVEAYRLKVKSTRDHTIYQLSYAFKHLLSAYCLPGTVYSHWRTSDDVLKDREHT